MHDGRGTSLNFMKRLILEWLLIILRCPKDTYDKLKCGTLGK